jgi:hypothetical protein
VTRRGDPIARLCAICMALPEAEERKNLGDTDLPCARRPGVIASEAKQSPA